MFTQQKPENWLLYYIYIIYIFLQSFFWVISYRKSKENIFTNIYKVNIHKNIQLQVYLTCINKRG